MNGARERPDAADDPPEAGSPPTEYERTLVRGAGAVVERCAQRIARQFPRIVRDDGLMTLGDLGAIGHKALYRAARNYDPGKNPAFNAFATYYVSGDMLDAIDALLFEERVKCAAAKAKNNHAAFHTSDGYDVMKHDQAEARRRFRAFLNGHVAAMFVTSIEEAAQWLDLAELDERRAFEHALAIVQVVLRRLTETDRRMIWLMYREHMDLSAACKALGVPYGTARARNARALKLLHDHLVEQGITEMPRPLVVPDVTGTLDACAMLAKNEPSGTG